MNGRAVCFVGVLGCGGECGERQEERDRAWGGDAMICQETPGNQQITRFEFVSGGEPLPGKEEEVADPIEVIAVFVEGFVVADTCEAQKVRIGDLYFEVEAVTSEEVSCCEQRKVPRSEPWVSDGS